MASFTDDKGRVWPIQITPRLIAEVHRQGYPRFMTTNAVAEVGKLAADAVLASGVLWLSCKALARERRIEQREFYRDVLDIADCPAATALGEAVAGFFEKSIRNLKNGRRN